MKSGNSIVLAVLLSFLWCAQAVGSNQGLHNPGIRAFHEATELYQAGAYDQAFDKYVNSARWGNKLSQFNIGTMYYNGVGRGRDAARAWAWIRLSAEREYPQLVMAEQEIWQELDETEKRRAERILRSELLPEYGDEVTLPAVRRYMDQRHRSATGSRRGGAAGSNALLVHPRDDVKQSGETYYRDDAWSVDAWLAQERAWFAELMEAGEPIVQFEER